jgi:hypothetical protein
MLSASDGTDDDDDDGGGVDGDRDDGDESAGIGNGADVQDYDGYGEFGGKDYYELLAELNGAGQDREMGITIAFKDNPSGDNTPNVIYPKLVEFLDQDVETQYNRLPNPKSCKHQGYFYN